MSKNFPNAFNVDLMKTVGYFFTLGLLASTLASRFHEKLSPDVSNDWRVEKTLRCVGAAARALFTRSNDVSFVTSDRHPHPVLVRELLKKTFAHRSVKVLTKFRTDPIDGPSYRESSFVLVDNDVNYGRLLEDPQAERWAEFIVVTESTTEWLAKFADRLWNLGFIKVAFVHVTPEGVCSLHRPIQDPSSRGSRPRLKVFDIVQESPTSNSASPETIDQMKPAIHPFASMLQTPTNATLTYAKIMEGTQSGNSFTRFTPDGKRTSLGVDILQMFASKYNIELQRYDWEDQDATTWTDAMKRCIAGEFDVFYARELASDKNCCGQVEPLAWYTYQTLVFADSLRKTFHPFRGFFLPYRKYVWLCTFLLVVTFSLFAYWVGILRRHNFVRERVTVLQIWAVFMGQSLHVLPAKFCLRFALGIWIVGSLNNSLMYTGIFSSTLTASDGSDLLETFQDILDSGRPICGSNKTKQFLNYSQDPVLRVLHDRLEPIVSMEVINKILRENYIGSCHMRYVMAHNWVNRANHSLQLYIPAESAVVSYPSYYFVRKRHPYQKDFIQMVTIARESGLLEYLYHLYSSVWGETAGETLLASSGDSFIGMRHLQVLFNILLVGHFVAGLVFLVELHTPRKLVEQRKPRI